MMRRPIYRYAPIRACAFILCHGIRRISTLYLGHGIRRISTPRLDDHRGGGGAPKATAAERAETCVPTCSRTRADVHGCGDAAETARMD